MTDPTGWSFLSYRRARAEEADLLIATQHEHGIPTWQDIKDLGEGPTEDQLLAVLDDPRTANAIAWLTPEVADSAVIRRVEIPRIVRRADSDDVFFPVLIAAGGLGYEDAKRVATENLGIHDLSTWNLVKATGDSASDAHTISYADAVRVVERVLRRRLETLHAHLPPDAPLQVGVYAHVPAPSGVGDALKIDWSHHFRTGRLPTDGVWDEKLLPSLRRIAHGIAIHCPGRRVVACGRPTISVATAFGSAFPSPAGVSLTWRQEGPGRPAQEWGLDVPREESGFAARITAGATSGSSLAVLVSVAEDVSVALGACRDELPCFRAFVRLEPTGDLPHTLECGGQAADVAWKVLEGIRAARRQYVGIESIHLFMACPAGVAMMVGQLLNTLGGVAVYEHVEVDAVGRYRQCGVVRARVEQQ